MCQVHHYTHKTHCFVSHKFSWVSARVLCWWDLCTWCCLWLKTKQKRELVGKTERTTSDKLRERRLKKRRQKAQRLQKEKREKVKAEKTARLGSMKNLMDTVATSKQEVKNKKKTHQSVSKSIYLSNLPILCLRSAVFWTDLLIQLIAYCSLVCSTKPRSSSVLEVWILIVWLWQIQFLIFGTLLINLLTYLLTDLFRCSCKLITELHWKLLEVIAMWNAQLRTVINSTLVVRFCWCFYCDCDCDYWWSTVNAVVFAVAVII